MKKKIIILGGTGFIGETIYNNLNEHRTFNVKRCSSSDFNLEDYDSILGNDFNQFRCDYLIMSAAKTRDLGDSLVGLKKNIDMAISLSYLLNIKIIKHLIFISSVGVYGNNNLNLPLDEFSRLNPIDYYSTSKLVSEKIFNKVCNENTIPFTILRLPGVYGPRDTHNSPLKTFILSVLKNEPITIFGDGEQMRDYLFVIDIGDIIKNICKYNIVGTYNVVSSNSCSINHMLAIITKIHKKRIKIKYDHRDSYTYDLVFKKSGLLKLIPGTTFTTMEAGIKVTYDYYLKQNSTVNVI